MLTIGDILRDNHQTLDSAAPPAPAPAGPENLIDPRRNFEEPTATPRHEGDGQANPDPKEMGASSSSPEGETTTGQLQVIEHLLIEISPLISNPYSLLYVFSSLFVIFITLISFISHSIL